MIRFSRRPNVVGSFYILLFILSWSVAAANEFPAPTWKVASPESQGLDSAVLAEAVEYVRLKRLPLHSFLVVRNGVMVLNAYFWPYGGREVHDVASVTKSFTSTAVGLAIDKGFVAGVDARVDQFFPSVRSDSDPRRSRLSLRHLLTMTSGFDCNADGGEKALAAMRGSPDWAAHVTGLPMIAEPGSQFAYCSCNNQVLSGVVTAATGTSAAHFLKANLFDPLGIKDALWPQDPQGRSHGWGDLHLHPTDMAKVGLLFLNEGRWGSRQILSRDWIRNATRESVPVRSGVGYGYSWWINTERPPIFEAVGRGGQRISVLPKENIVLVFTGGGANTDDIAPFLFRSIRSSVAIPENKVGQQKLRRALSESLKEVIEPSNSSTPALASSVTGVTYALAPNPLDLRTFRLDFKKGKKAVATLVFGDTKWIAPVGLDGRRRFAPSGPHGLVLASAGRWVSDSEFLLDIDTVANVNHFLFRLRVDRDQVEIRMSETTGEMTDLPVACVVSKR
jgi:CubicO group peptidase (beta-lactamase class C family)